MASFSPPSSPVTSPNNDSRTPPEIIDAVLDQLASNRKDIASFHTLLLCSLVSRQVSRRCRMHIFHEVNLGWSKNSLRSSEDSQTLTSGTVSGLVDILLGNPSLSEHIRSLRINPGFYFFNNSHQDDLCLHLSTLLERMPRLSRFALTYGSDPDAVSLPWSWFPPVAQGAIEACCAQPTIRCLEFRGFIEFPTALIYSCSPSLTTLYLSRTMAVSVADLEQNMIDHVSSDQLPPPPWSLMHLVCQNALPLLRSAINHEERNADEGPFARLQHLNVAILTTNDSRLVAPLLLQSMGSMRTLEVSFSVWEGESQFETNWVQLSLLQRIHVSVCCVHAQPVLHFPPEVPYLIYDVVHNQTSVRNLSLHVTCQMAYMPLSGGDNILEDASGWSRLSGRLTPEFFSSISTFRISMSIVLVQREVETTRAVCEEVQGRLREELMERFESTGRGLDLAISVQSLRELFPPTELDD